MLKYLVYIALVAKRLWPGQARGRGRSVEMGGRKLEMGGRKLEMGGRKLEMGGRKLEMGGRNVETGVGMSLIFPHISGSSSCFSPTPGPRPPTPGPRPPPSGLRKWGDRTHLTASAVGERLGGGGVTGDTG
jgi:hypothetical protein